MIDLESDVAEEFATFEGRIGHLRNEHLYFDNEVAKRKSAHLRRALAWGLVRAQRKAYQIPSPDIRPLCVYCQEPLDGSGKRHVNARGFAIKGCRRHG